MASIFVISAAIFVWVLILFIIGINILMSDIPYKKISMLIFTYLYIVVSIEIVNSIFHLF